jgi:hypothetical protein
MSWEMGARMVVIEAEEVTNGVRVGGTTRRDGKNQEILISAGRKGPAVSRCRLRPGNFG